MPLVTTARGILRAPSHLSCKLPVAKLMFGRSLKGFPRPEPPEPGRSCCMDDDYPYQAKDQIKSLVETLETLTKRDPEQEVQGIALPVLDAVIETVRAVLPDNPVVEAVRGILSPEQIALGEPIRAADALLVAKQLDAAIGSYPPAVA
jgi:hypothetical protein